MTAVTAPAQLGEHIRVPWWAMALLVVGILTAYLILQENGWLVSNWMTIHEFFHDGRHTLGFPCH